MRIFQVIRSRTTKENLLVRAADRADASRIAHANDTTQIELQGEVRVVRTSCEVLEDSFPDPNQPNLFGDP